MYQIDLFRTSAFLFLPARGPLSCSRPPGMQGARTYTTAQARALVKVLGACSGPTKPRTLANNQGETFRLHTNLTPPRGSYTTFRSNFEEALHAALSRCCGEQASKMTSASYCSTFSCTPDSLHIGNSLASTAFGARQPGAQYSGTTRLALKPLQTSILET